MPTAGIALLNAVYGFVVSAEHASAAIPEDLCDAFADAAPTLGTHWAWDAGAGLLAQRLAQAFGVHPHCGAVSRLVVDCNRSPGHPRLFSRWTERLEPALKQALLDRYYWPLRNAVREDIDRALLRCERVLHLSVHSFAEVYEGRRREADVGLLYDPAQAGERALCRSWQQRLTAATGYRVRRNYPYRGVSDGHVTALRRRYPADRYCGVELEMNQRLVGCAEPSWATLVPALVATLTEALPSATAIAQAMA